MAGKGALFLGTTVGPSGKPERERLALDSSDLTTHGVIVGMTGSGKTGVGIVLLEEALLAGIPVLALDPKGDLGNLALTFPDLSAADFRPWVNESDATANGMSVEDYAATCPPTHRRVRPTFCRPRRSARRRSSRAPRARSDDGSSTGERVRSAAPRHAAA